MPKWQLENAYVKSWSTSGSAESQDSFDFKTDMGPDTAGDPPTISPGFGFTPIKHDYGPVSAVREEAVLDFALTGDDTFAKEPADDFTF